MFLKKIADTLWQYWLKFGRILGKIQTTIILSLIYFVVLSPIGLIKQIFSPKKPKDSYWIDLEEKSGTLEESYEQY